MSRPRRSFRTETTLNISQEYETPAVPSPSRPEQDEGTEVVEDSFPHTAAPENRPDVRLSQDVQGDGNELYAATPGRRASQARDNVDSSKAKLPLPTEGPAQVLDSRAESRSAELSTTVTKTSMDAKDNKLTTGAKAHEAPTTSKRPAGRNRPSSRIDGKCHCSERDRDFSDA